MDRRAFLELATTGLLAAVPAAAQSAPPARLGYLGIASGPLADAFLDGVRQLGYTEGQNLVVERRQYEGNIPQLPKLAAELVRLKVDVIFATGPAPVHAVAHATRDIPLVAIDLESDPIEAGFVKNLAHPGGNITGVFLDLPELIGKWFEFFRTLSPQLSRVAVLWDPSTGQAQRKAAIAAARLKNMRLDIVEVRTAEDFAGAFGHIARSRPQALIELSSPLVYLEASRVADFVVSKRIPAISLFRVFPDAGGLMSYGPDIADLYRRSGVYVGQVLKGAKTSELPIERPAQFFLTINLKTAKALGLTIPPSLLQRRFAGGLGALVRPLHGRDLARRVVLEALPRSPSTAAAGRDRDT